MKRTELDTHAQWHLGEPFWRSKRMSGESLFFVRETPGDFPCARLLFQPVGGVQIASASREVVFTKNRDYVVDSRTAVVTLPHNSRIPFTDRAELYPDVDGEHSIPHKRGENGIGLYFGEGHLFHDLQVEASYRHHSTWQGYLPEHQPGVLPKTAARLETGAGLTLCVCGDSISAGANASGRTGARPGMPPYPELLAEELRRISGGHVVLRNHAVGGKRVRHGLEVVDAMMADQPDLAVVAYGMNDADSTTVDQYRTCIAGIVDRIRTAAPGIEIILVASMLGNPQWNATPTEAFIAFRDALRSQCGQGLILADLTQLWADLLQFKSYHDLTGNGVNHPNDFGHRIYAQVLLDLIVEVRS